MPYLPSAQAILKKLRGIDKYVVATAGGSTTATTAIDKDDTALTVASLTGFGDLDKIFIVGDGGLELQEIDGDPATLSIPLLRKALFNHSSGAQILEAVKQSLGHIAEDSARFGGSSQLNPVNAATSDVPIAYFGGGGELTWAFSLVGLSSRTIATAFGIREQETGNGTEADPYTQIIGETTVGTEGLLCFRSNAILKNGWFVEVDFLDCVVQVSADVNISGKSGNPVPVTGKCANHIIRMWQ
jgi:hypothetical protein